MNWILVPSADFTPQGLGPSSIKRCEAAALLWAEGGFDGIVVSGGTRSFWWERSTAEAVSMKELLKSMGVDANSISIEGKAVDTYQNLILSVRLLEGQEARTSMKITVATDRLHFRRFKVTAKALGVEVHNCEIHAKNSLRRIIIEALPLVVHFMDPLGEGFLAKRNRRQRSSPHEMMEASPPLA